MGNAKRIIEKCCVLSRICLLIGCCLSVGFYFVSVRQDQQSMKDVSTTNTIVSVVNVIDPNQVLINNLTCIKTKTLFNLYSTTICIHKGGDYVSTIVAQQHIWEEDYITRLLRILIRNPHLDMIDI